MRLSKLNMINDLTFEPVFLTETQIERIAQALAAPRRYQLLLAIGATDGPCACSMLLEHHPISAATLSHHLKELERAELIHYHRDGKFKSMTLRREVLRAYTDQLGRI